MKGAEGGCDERRDMTNRMAGVGKPRLPRQLRTCRASRRQTLYHDRTSIATHLPTKYYFSHAHARDLQALHTWVTLRIREKISEESRMNS